MAIVQQPALAPRWYVNGFPKSGIHLLALQMRPIANVASGNKVYTLPWSGTFRGNGWTNERIPTDKLLLRLAYLNPAEYIIAHCGYDDQIETFLRLYGVAHIFLYRDLRDIAVSQAFHILNEDDETHMHPDKELYKGLGSFDNVLEACITGLDEYPGVIERWEQYAPWVDVPWVHKVTFEQITQAAHETMAGIVRYGFQRPYDIVEYNLPLLPDSVEAAAQLMTMAGSRPQESITFRKGTSGGWRDHFTNRHKRLFKNAGGADWLIELDYEKNTDW